MLFHWHLKGKKNLCHSENNHKTLKENLGLNLQNFERNRELWKESLKLGETVKKAETLKVQYLHKFEKNTDQKPLKVF